MPLERKLCVWASLAFSLWRATSAVECGTWISNECLGEQDRRYDTGYPIGLIDLDTRWEYYQGFWSAELTFYGEDGQIVQPQLFSPSNPAALPYKQERFRGFFNHTFVGSRFIMDRYYVYPPADPAFCSQAVMPPQKNTLSNGGGVCGINGIAFAAGGYGTSTHEKNGDMTVFKGYGLYRRTSASVQRMIDDYTMMATASSEYQSNMNVLVYLNDDRSIVSGSLSRFNLGADAGLAWQSVLKMSKVTEAEFLQGIQQAYTDFSVLPADQVQGGVIPMSTASLDPTAYPTEEEWCGTDPACSTSPYQEPEGTLKAGVIAAFVTAVAVVIIAALLVCHWYRMKQQAHRYRERFMRRIAEHIKLEGHMECLTEDQLAEEFKRIDSGGDGYIQKEELKDFMMSGKAGKLSESDFNAMWVALDFDRSGKVDFIEFCTFLSRCGSEYDELATHQSTLSREDKQKHAAMHIARKGTSNIEEGAAQATI